jgi:hypothetical protein
MCLTLRTNSGLVNLRSDLINNSYEFSYKDHDQ